MSATFESLGLSPESLATLRRARFEAPTPIQAQAIPPALTGRDVVGCAATGTGKTAAFLLPLMERFREQKSSGTLGLVLAPTRELVMQIAEQARFFGEAHGLTHAVVIGGEDMGEQVEALKSRPTFVIATPGRLVDLMGTRSVSLAHVRALVLDEADRMLDMGFQPQLEEILKAVPRDHQTLLFSATLGHDVTEFAGRAMRKPARVEVTPSGTPAPKAAQKLYLVKQDEKWALLFALLARDEESALIFARTKQRADKVQEALKREGYKAACIHADRTQNQRKQALAGFARGQYRCLVATDIAARGLDVEDIGHVINFDLPHSPEDYVHRIGRTARAGASGRASTFATDFDGELINAVEKIIRARIPRADVPREDPVFKAELARFDAAQRDPGPRQPDHGVSKRNPAKPLGRHAISHGKGDKAAGAGPGPKDTGTGPKDAGHAPVPRAASKSAGPRDAGTGHKVAGKGAGHKAASKGPGYKSASKGPGYKSASAGAGYKGASKGPGYKSASAGAGYKNAGEGSGYKGASKGSGYKGASKGTGYKSAGESSGYKGASKGTGYKGTNYKSNGKSAVQGKGAGRSRSTRS